MKISEYCEESTWQAGNCDSILFGNDLLWGLPDRFSHFVICLYVFQLRLKE